MKTLKLLFIFALALSATLLYGQAVKDTLTNDKIVKLSKIGLQPTVIISKIETSVNLFDVSTDGLIYLSSEGVHADVINKMMEVDAQAKAAIANQKDMNDPLTMRSVGIYYYQPAVAEKPLRRVDPTVISTNKVGGGGITISLPGVSGTSTEKLKSTLSGGDARLQLTETSPVFYFYFDRNNPNADSWFFATATSPNEFSLVKLTEKGKYREMVVATANAYKESTGISDRVKVPFDYTEEAEGVYKVFFTEPLKKGEYCFLYASDVPSMYNNDKVFDFGINPVE